MSIESKQHPIELLTQEALSASEVGQWDHVASLYQRRGVEFVFDELSPAVINRLIEIDTKIQERAKIVHAAAKQNLQEAQMKRRKFQHWRQQLSYSHQTGSRFLRSV